MTSGRPEVSESEVRVFARHRTTRADGLIVEIDPRLPGSTTGRTVYHAVRGETYLSAAHQHGEPHEFICLKGECSVGYQGATGLPVIWCQLSQGDALTLPGSLAHRVRLGKGCIMSASTPSIAWLSTSGTVWLPDDETWVEP